MYALTGLIAKEELEEYPDQALIGRLLNQYLWPSSGVVINRGPSFRQARNEEKSEQRPPRILTNEIIGYTIFGG